MSRFVLTAQLQLQAPNNVSQVVRQIQSQLNNVSVNVQVQGAQQAQRQLQQVTAQTQAATSAADRMGRAFAISIRRFAAFSIATRAVGLFTSTLSDAVREAIDFQREMVRVSQVTGEALGKLKFLAKAVTDLSTGLGVSSKDLLTTGQLLLQAGVNAKDTEIALKTLAKAALAPNFDSLSETTEGAIAILAQFQEGVGALEKQLGAINAVAGAFAVEAGDLIDVIRRAGGIFKSSGGDLNELIALFTSVRATTRESAESIGTGLRTIFTRIQRPKTIEFLKQFGVELVDLEGKFVGPFEAVKRLSTALSGLGEGDITFIRIAEELGGFRQIGKVLPLLQQFSTAQSALNVAQKAGNSLTTDAATAQQALAIRILKVKEEFLALIRSMTETSTFQIMANTALSLASALIKIGEAIKPLLPLLAAVAAVNFARGIGTFAGGIMRGMQSGRTYSTGGKVHHFARGGMVPGTGNRDTVPAMLQPGEFVIKKSSVNKLGAGNLAAMNENGYAAGGIVQSGRNLYGSLGPAQLKSLAINRAGGPKAYRALSQTDKEKLKNDVAREMAEKGRAKGEDPQSVISGARLATKYGVSFLEGALGGNFGATINQVIKSGNATGVTALKQAIAKDGRRVLPGARIESPNASVAFLQPTAKEIFDNEIMGGLPKLFDEATSKFGAPLKPGKVGINELVSNSAVQAIKGYFFEGFARRVSQNLIADSVQDKTDPIFDFTGAGNVDDLKRMFGGKFTDPNEFKVAPTTDNIANAISKAISLRGTSGLQFFAAGGSVGTDTVPALLTPGEFVVNRSSAQRIGYGNLNRMNKVGKYARGGVVQRFAAGTPMSGAKTSGGVSIPGFNAQPFNLLEKAILSLVTNFSSTLQISNKVQSKWAMLDKISPALAHALDGYISALNLSHQDALELTSAYNSLVNKLVKQGVSADEATATITPYIHSLQAATKAHKNTAAVATSAPTVSPTLPRRQAGTQPIAPLQGPAPAAAATATQQNTQATNANTNAQKSAASSAIQVVNNNKMFAASMATSLIAGFLPAIDENSGAALRMTHALLGLVTTITSVGFALEAFGIKLKMSSITDLFSKGAGKGIAGLAARAGGTAGSAVLGMGGGAPLAMAASTVTSALTTIAVPIAAATATFFAIQSAGNALVEAFMNYDGQIKKAIESGNVEKARNLGAVQQQSRTGVNVAAGATAGAVLGGLLGGPFVAALGAAAGGAIAAFLSDSSEYAGQVAATQAALANSQKELSKASENATKALSDFEKGNISATQLLQTTVAATAAVAQSRLESNRLIAAGEANRDTGFSGSVRNVVTLGGLLGESSGERDARITAEQQKSREGVQKQEQEAIRIAQPAMNALSKQVAMTGGSFDDLMNKIRATDPNLYEILIRQGTNDLNNSFQNVAKEVARTKAALEATNLGLRSAEATSTAMSSSMDRFAAGLEVGGSTFVANTEFLSQAMTSAAQAMDPTDIKAAISDVSKNLSEMGVSPAFVKKFEGNTNALVQAQQNYGKAFDNIIKESKDMGTVFSADVLKDKFADQLSNMMGPDVSDEAKKNLSDIIKGIDLNPDEVNEIMSGNYQAFGDKLSEAGKKQFESIMKIAQERQKAEQVVIGLIQKRADAERNLANAQKEAVDLYMEGRDVQAKYGGAAVTSGEKRAAIVARANAGANIAGLGQMRSGSVAEIRARNAQIAGGMFGIETARRTDGGMQGRQGAEAENMQQNLQQAQKDQVQTIRDLIKLEEEELKIIQEKNKLEKDSMESLISGDIDKFFEQQAAVGAQAAIATGDMSLANQFGSKAVGDAFKDIQRQQEAGVQSLFGRQLAGPGGLTEAAASAALGARGIMDPRMAQTLAGTTPEEEASKRRLQELGGVLTEAGAWQQATAEMQVQTASINVTRAEVKLAQIEERGRQAAEGFARGGVVYANRGMFVPRGTDTVPAMLTPGEFVVRREAVNRGNNLQLLEAINNNTSSQGFARGGKVGYYNNGGKVQYKAGGGILGNIAGAFGIDPQVVTNLGNVFNTFVSGFNDSIKNLQNTKLQVKLDSVNVNVNLNGTSMLTQISDQSKQEIMKQVVQKIQNEYSVGPGGKLTENRSNLPR